MSKVKLKSTDKPLYYIGIDGTDAIDTVVWGHMWNAKFGWRNLLWELDRDPADNQRRVDKAHPSLPILRLKRKHANQDFADTCIMPEGKDGKGVDDKWPSNSNPNLNITEMNQGIRFMQTFILNPSADKVKSSLNDSGEGVVASVVYISSHGVAAGDMFGETSNNISAVDYTFSLIETVATKKEFSGPDWLLLSNCKTLVSSTHNDWLDVMKGPKPLRGVVGFQDTCPLAKKSADIFAKFIDLLAQGKTILESFSDACTAKGISDNWVVVCHEDAKGDTISGWNARMLKPISPATSKIFMFNKANPKGTLVIHAPDPFEVFWSKGNTRITAANRSNLSSKIEAKDTVTITVKPPTLATNFTAGTTIIISLIYIRINYKQAINVNKMFKIKGQSGASVSTTAKLNSDSVLTGGRPSSVLGPDDGDDSWILKVIATPAEITLTLECVDLDISKINHHNVPYWLRVKLKQPSQPDLEFDFIRNGSIIVK